MPRLRPRTSRAEAGPRPPLQGRSADAAIPKGTQGLSELPLEDRGAGAEDMPCDRDLLESLGPPIKVRLTGRTVFVCREGSVEELVGRPEKSPRQAEP